VQERDSDPMTRSTSTGTSSTATETAKQASESAKQTASQVADTAMEQGRQVAGQVRQQARSVAADVRQSVGQQARTGNQKMAEGLRRIADDLGTMADGQAGSPAQQLVTRLSDSGRRAADYLEQRGPEGVLDEIQEFARRKPGTFLLAAAAAGFVIGRLGRSTFKAARSDQDVKGGDDAYRAYAGYESGTAYDTAPPAPTGGTLTDPYATPTTGTTYDPRVEGVAVGTASVESPGGYPVESPATTTPERGDYR